MSPSERTPPINLLVSFVPIFPYSFWIDIFASLLAKDGDKCFQLSPFEYWFIMTKYQV